MTQTASRWGWRALMTVATLAAGFIAACGGVGSGGTGASFTSGAVTGFGSVIVSGVHYDETRARIEDDEGRQRSAAELRLGMVTDIEYTPTGATTALAQSIRFRSDLIGPVTMLDLVAKQLTVMGQQVFIRPTTVIDIVSLPGGLGSVSTGDVLEVYGQFDVATSGLIASRVERHGAVPAYKVRGPIASIDRTAKTLVIGGQTIDYSGVSDLPSSLLTVGRFVRVSLQTVPTSGGAWLAISLGQGALQFQEGADVEVEGRVSAYTSATVFSVNGIPVDASRATVSGSASGLILGAHVNVKGSSVGGTLVASRVEVDDNGTQGGDAFDLSGQLTALDAVAQTFVVRGVTVDYGAGTSYQGGGPANLAVGREVEVRGALSSDGTRVDASLIKFD